MEPQWKENTPSGEKKSENFLEKIALRWNESP
jgi:hypothetical protein